MPEKELAIPDQIRIGPVWYTIEQSDEVIGSDGAKLHGDINADDREGSIRICTKGCPSRIYVVLWHEIIHGILNHAGLFKVKEDVVGRTAYGIARVLEDNPWLGEMASQIMAEGRQAV